MKSPTTKIKKISQKDMSVSFYNNVRNIIEHAHSNAYRAVNFAMVQAYWNVGRMIVEEEQSGKNRADYGEKLILLLSDRLTEDFGKGFDSSNLKRMRQFYLLFPIGDAVRHLLQDGKQHKRKSGAVSHQLEKDRNTGKNFIVNDRLKAELSWTHYRLLLKIDNSIARDFYINETIDNNWSTRQLDRQINSLYYERLLASRNKKEMKKSARVKTEIFKPEDIIKDPYVLEFLNLSTKNKYLERELESALIDQLQNFLLELGRGFAFIERQQRISVEDDDFYIDLVFYNYILKCFVLIDLKVGKLTHQDIGQMDMYIRMYEDLKKNSGDNPTIGLILCSQKNETVVKYSVMRENKKLFASKYMLYLPTVDEIKKGLVTVSEKLVKKQ